MARLIYSQAVNEARMAATEQEIGANPVMRLYGLASGESVPATCAEDAGTLLIAEGQESTSAWMGLPSTQKTPDFVARANIYSSWILTVIAEGEVAYLRIYDSSGMICGMQCEVRHVSTLTPSGTQDDETGVYGAATMEAGCVYMSETVMTAAHVSAGAQITLDELAFTAGNQARYIDV